MQEQGRIQIVLHNIANRNFTVCWYVIIVSQLTSFKCYDMIRGTMACDNLIGQFNGARQF
jgi:hypothetical protein